MACSVSVCVLVRCVWHVVRVLLRCVCGVCEYCVFYPQVL